MRKWCESRFQEGLTRMQKRSSHWHTSQALPSYSQSGHVALANASWPTTESSKYACWVLAGWVRKCHAARTLRSAQQKARMPKWSCSASAAARRWSSYPEHSQLVDHNKQTHARLSEVSGNLFGLLGSNRSSEMCAQYLSRSTSLTRPMDPVLPSCCNASCTSGTRPWSPSQL